MRAFALLCCCAVVGCGRFETTIPQATRPAAAPTTSAQPGVNKAIATTSTVAPAKLIAPVKARFEIDVYEAYGQNEAAADLKYTDKPVELFLRGKIAKMAGRYVIYTYSLERPEITAPNVIARIRAEDYPKLAKSRPGQTFKVVGICRGRQEATGAWKGYAILFDDCRIISMGRWRGGVDGEYLEGKP